MILTKNVLVKLHRTNIKHYESLCYFIPRYKNINYAWKVKQNTFIEVKVKDLLSNSHIKVHCKCDECGKEQILPYKKIKKVGKYFCHSCSLRTGSFKEKLRKINTGKHPSKETKNKMSRNSYSHKMAGINHPNYNPDISDEERKRQHQIPGITRWKRLVKERDKYTCQKCGSKENLKAHHINNFSNFKEQRIMVKNGIALCNDCHKAIHKRFGKFTLREHLNYFIV